MMILFHKIIYTKQIEKEWFYVVDSKEITPYSIDEEEEK